MLLLFYVYIMSNFRLNKNDAKYCYAHLRDLNALNSTYQCIYSQKEIRSKGKFLEHLKEDCIMISEH